MSQRNGHSQLKSALAKRLETPRARESGVKRRFSASETMADYDHSKMWFIAACLGLAALACTAFFVRRCES
jgi:hypothetical protein